MGMQCMYMYHVWGVDKRYKAEDGNGGKFDNYDRHFILHKKTICCIQQVPYSYVPDGAYDYKN